MNDECTYTHMLQKLPQYAVGTLEPDELLAMDAYLQRHRELFAQLRAFEEAAAHEPPGASDMQQLLLVRQRIIERALFEPHQARARRARVPVPRSASARRWMAATSGALIMLLVLVLYTFSLRQQRQQALLDVGAAQTSVARVHQIDADLQQQHRNEQHDLSIIAGAEATVALVGTPAQPNARGTLYVCHGERVLVLQGIQPATAQQTYEVWLGRADGSSTPLMSLAIHDAGPTMVALPIPPDARAFTKISVSLEPRDTRLMQPGPIVLFSSQF